MEDIRVITPIRVITVFHLFDNLPLSKKKKIAAPIMATEINQKDPPTTSWGNNNLFITTNPNKNLLTSIYLLKQFKAKFKSMKQTC